MLHELMIIFGLRDDPVTGAFKNAHAIFQHSMDRAVIADRAAVRNADATRLLNETLLRASQG